jgi:hypothetical protein
VIEHHVLGEPDQSITMITMTWPEQAVVRVH